MQWPQRTRLDWSFGFIKIGVWVTLSGVERSCFSRFCGVLLLQSTAMAAFFAIILFSYIEFFAYYCSINVRACSCLVIKIVFSFSV